MLDQRTNRRVREAMAAAAEAKKAPALRQPDPLKIAKRCFVELVDGFDNEAQTINEAVNDATWELERLAEMLADIAATPATSNSFRDKTLEWDAAATSLRKVLTVIETGAVKMQLLERLDIMSISGARDRIESGGLDGQ